MSFFRFIIGLILVVVIAVLAVMNSDVVVINLWPFYIDIKAKMSVVIIALVLVGYIAGKFDTWAAYSPLRSALRAQRRQNKKLNVEKQKLVEKVEGLNENIENLKHAEPTAISEPKVSKTVKFRQKLSSMFKKKPKQEDFWCL